MKNHSQSFGDSNKDLQAATLQEDVQSYAGQKENENDDDELVVGSDPALEGTRLALPL